MMIQTPYSLLALSLSFNNTLANQGDHPIVAFSWVETRLKANDDLFPGSDQESEGAPQELFDFLQAHSFDLWGEPSQVDVSMIGGLI
jgi:hypothetical protein